MIIEFGGRGERVQADGELPQDERRPRCEADRLKRWSRSRVANVVRPSRAVDERRHAFGARSWSSEGHARSFCQDARSPPIRPAPGATGLVALAYGEGSIWAGSQYSRVARIDPRSGRRLATVAGVDHPRRWQSVRAPSGLSPAQATRSSASTRAATGSRPAFRSADAERPSRPETAPSGSSPPPKDASGGSIRTPTPSPPRSMSAESPPLSRRPRRRSGSAPPKESSHVSTHIRTRSAAPFRSATRSPAWQSAATASGSLFSDGRLRTSKLREGLRAAQVGPFARCQDYNEKSCKSQAAAIPLARREHWASNCIVAPGARVTLRS
jgi:hypothetical protein